MFKFKNLFVVACALTTTLALAQAPQTQAAGKGLAKNRESAAKFEMRAGYSRNNDLNAVFNITVGGDDAPNRVHIDLKRANDLTFDHRNHKATLNGLAVLAVKSGDQIRRIEGRIEITVVDIAHPQRDDVNLNDAENDRQPHDRIIVKFHAINSDTTYSFEGLVLRGDIKIGAPIRDR